ncbi:PKD domain-containing protein [Candidatus Woesearchaeota archaeon]|nr:MAG: PKD domain-containing protein [Candidatus Woesearchaeota archaeon]
MKNVLIFSVVLLLLTGFVMAVPNAVISANPTNGVAPLTVAFDGTGSTGNIVSYSWDFGDTSTANTAAVNHQFANPGTYNVVLTVTDNESATDTATETITVTPSASSGIAIEGDLDFGDENQVRETTLTKTITIKNTGSNTLTDIVLSSTAATKYGVTFSPATIASLNSLQTAQVVVSLTVPDDQDAGQAKAGIVAATGTASGQTVTAQKDILVSAESNLRIEDVDYEIDGGDSGDLDNGEDFDSAPGDQITLTIKVENTFSDDIDIEDITVTVEGEGDVDVDEEENIDTLRDDDSDTVTITFDVDSDADEDEYDIDITVEGEDENGASHDDQWTITVNVEKKTHDIQIINLELSKTTVTCENSITLEAELSNEGTKDEGSVVIEAESALFDWKGRLVNIDIDEGDEYTARFTIALPKNLEEGEYPIDVTAFYKPDEETDTQSVSFTANGCNPEPIVQTHMVCRSNACVEVSGSGNDECLLNSDCIVEEPEFPDGNVVYGNSGQAIPNWMLLALLGVGVLIAVVLIIVLLVRLAR